MVPPAPQRDPTTAESSRDEMAHELQEDIHSLDKWAEKWQLTFNTDNGKVMHIGVKNQRRSYKMLKGVDIKELEKPSIEKDLGVNVDNQLKFSNHIEMQVNKGNKILSLIRRSFTYLDRKSMLTMYKTLVRPLLEYGHTIMIETYKFTHGKYTSKYPFTNDEDISRR